MSYIGSTPTTQSFISGTDYFNGDGATTAFTLTRTVNSVNDIEAVVNNVVQQPNSAYTLSGTTITFTSAPSAGTNNIYVRYLSTTTQSITPSQNTVSYSTLNTDMQSGGYASNFKNRLINGAMAIDQRNAGASVTAAASTIYSVDRWGTYSNPASKFTIQQNAGSVTPPVGYKNYLGCTSASTYSPSGTDIFIVYQNIEGYNIADLAWGTANAQPITISFWVRSSLTGSFGAVVSGGTWSYPILYTISSANTWEQKTITIAGATTGTWGSTNGTGIILKFSLGVGSSFAGTSGTISSTDDIYGVTGQTQVVGTNGATFYITGVQLEKGSTATSFDYRPYGTELSLCQRYYTNFASTSDIYAYTAQAFASDGAKTQAIDFKVSMRAVPTVTLGTAGTSSGQSSFLGAANNYVTVGTHTANSITPQQFMIFGAGYSSTGWSVGTATSFYATGATTIWQASAEL